MKKNRNAFFMIVLAVVLCLCAAIIPGMTFAEEVTPGTVTVIATDGTSIVVDETDPVKTVGDGTVTYDVANNKVTLNGITAKKIDFTMNGDFTVELVGSNLIENTEETRQIFYIASGNIIIDGSGSLKVTGNTDQYLFNNTGGGDTTIAGGVVEIVSETCSNAFRGFGNCTITGGSVYVKAYSYACRYTASADSLFTMTGGTLTVEAVSSVGLFANNIDISGGDIVVSTPGNYGISSGSNGYVNISGGSVDVSVGGPYGIYSAGNMTISGGDVRVLATNADAYGLYAKKNMTISEEDPNNPTNIYVEADYALAIPTASTVFSVTGGRITGSGNNFFYSSKAMTATIGDEAIIDFDAATAPLKGASVTVQSGDIWEEGKGLNNLETASAVKTVKERPIVNVDLSASVTLNGEAQANVTVGLYEDGAQIATAVTDEKGQTSFTVEGLIAGYTYDYTVMQIAESGNGYLYDLEEKALSVFVNSNGVSSVDGDTVFNNIYSATYISITTDGGVKPLIDLAGDLTATTVTAGEGTVSYDADTGIVTLNNATAKKLDFTKLGRDFTLNVEGENNLGDSSVEKVISVSSANVTVEGTGKLTVVAKKTAINVQNGSYTQNGAVLDVDSVNGTYSLAATNDIVFNGGTFDGYSSSYYGIRSVEGGITITNATVTSVATANNIMASGGDLTVNSGTVNALVISSGTGNCVLRAAANINLLGGTVTATSDERVINAGQTLTVSPNVKLVLENLNTSAASTKRFLYGSLEDTGVFYVEGQNFAANGLKVETLVGDEVEALIPELTERINGILDGIVVSNNLTAEDIKAALAEIPASVSVSLTDHNKATAEQDGSFQLSITHGELLQITRTLVIEQLPTVTKIDYDFASNESGMAEGIITVTLSKDFAEGKYNLGLYWGTEDGPLSGYKALSLDHKRTVSGAAVSYSLDNRTVIPLGVTALWAVIDGVPAGSYEISADRRSNFGAEKYTFGILSDTHFGYAAAPGAFTNALTLFEAIGAKFVTIAGDFTSHSSQSEYDIFKETYNGKFTIPFFTTLGNHDSLDWTISQDLTTITAVQNMMNNVSSYANVNFTGENGEFKVSVNDAYLDYGVIYDYSVQYGDDLFIFLGIGANELELEINNTSSDKYGGTPYLTEKQLTWLKEELADSEEYQNVILMFHYPTKASGIPLYKESEAFQELSDVLKDYDNVVHFSGHFHNAFDASDVDFHLSQTAWYTWNGSSYVASQTDLGHTAVHVPSNYDKQTGYVATVYESGILLTGYNFETGEIIPHATFFVANEEPVKEANVTLSATVNGKDADVQLIDKDGNVIETVTSVDGVATFTSLTLEDGVYTYVVKQNATNGGGWFYDSNEYTITVTVADGVATIEGEAVFTNTDRVPFAAGEIVDGKYIVTETGKATEMGLIKIGDDYYYAGPNGVLVTGKYYAWRLNENCDITTGWYYFDSTGKLVDSG
ncbi:MAG: metallophosphoesterase, partial [Clostridia bacterium]|nr:metallophosphoesterase [Clostridia bacterium]